MQGLDGDAIITFFGAPICLDDHAKQAIDTTQFAR